MNRAFLAIAALLLGCSFAGPACAAQGRTVEVIDGDTLRAEVGTAAGLETIEINLRCADAPLLDAPFGKEAKAHLQSLLGAMDGFEYSVIDYCGETGAAAGCVEALVYPSPPKGSGPVAESDYVNARMIAAGMARNNGCRGVYSTLQTEAKNARRGIWSTSEKIAFAEPVPVAPAPQAPPKTSAAKGAAKPASSTAPSVTEVLTYSLVDRTVTIKSPRVSLTKAIEIIDKVSTLPVSIYLKEQQYLNLNLDRVPWQVALQQITHAADLKQLNINNKIELYTAAFYYENIAQHLKISGSDAVYINTRSGEKPKPAPDDGTTHYVYVNDFKNQAESQVASNAARGFIQANDGGGQVPVSNDGVFEVHGDQPQPAAEPVAPSVAAVDEKPALPAKVEPPPPAPVVKPEAKIAERPAEEPAKKTAPKPTSQVADKEPQAPTKKSVETPAQKTAKVEGKTPAAEEKTPAAPAKQPAAEKSPESPTRPSPAIGTSEIIALVAIVLVVIGGGFLLMRSAERTRRAAEQKTVSIPDPWQSKDEPVDETAQAIDAEYEKEILEELEHVADEPVPAVAATAANPVAEPVADPEPAAEAVPATAGKKAKGATKTKAKKSNLAGVMVTEGNYDVTVDDYQKYMVPPNREPRQDCLFEVQCTIGGETIDGIGLDISSGGIFVDSKEEFEIGTEVQLEFKLRDSDPEPIRCTSVITWRNERPDPIKPNYPNGFGVHFTSFEGNSEQAVLAYIEAMEAANSSAEGSS